MDKEFMRFDLPRFRTSYYRLRDRIIGKKKKSLPNDDTGTFAFCYDVCFILNQS